MSAHIANLSPVEKRALLAQLLKEKADRAKAPSPLSYGQRAWWFLYQLEPQNPAYNIMMPVRVLSEVDATVLRRVFERLVERHASLRTCYTTHEESLVQQVREEAEIDFEIVDASTWDEQRLRDAVTEEVHRPFDLEHGPLLHTKLYTLSEREHVLTMVVHHIAFDLWSLVLFVHELGVLYAAEKDGRPALLEPLKYRYTDFVQQQLKMVSGAEGERLWNYWSEQLSGELPVLNLPTNRTRPVVQTQRGAARRFTISPELSDRLKALSQSNGTTLYMTILAVRGVATPLQRPDRHRRRFTRRRWQKPRRVLRTCRLLRQPDRVACRPLAEPDLRAVPRAGATDRARRFEASGVSIPVAGREAAT
jgi:hypothetical protein